MLAWNMATAYRLHEGIGIDFFRYHVVCRQQEFQLVALRFFQKLARQFDLVFLHQGFADRLALGLEKGVGHAATDDEDVNFIQEIADDADLVAHLGAAQDRDERPLRMAQHFAQVLQFFLHEQTRRGLLHEAGDADRGGMGAMRRSESVVYVVVGQAGKLLGELGIVGFFFGMEAQILQQQSLALFQLSGHLFSFRADAFRAEAYVFTARQFLVQQHTQALRYGFEAHRGIGFALGPAEVGDQHQPRPVTEGVLNRGQRFANASVVHHPAIFERHIEIYPHEDAVIVER